MLQRTPMPSKGKGYWSFEIDGIEVLVGKGAKDNDRLTLEIAEPEDLWLHVAGGTPGSHVVVRQPADGSVIEATVIRKAAALAAYHSKARGAKGKVEVHICRVSDVRKPSGYPPGKVVLRRWESIKVYPKAAVD